MKQSSTFKVYAHTYNAEMLNPFDLELLCKGTKFAHKNKFKRLLSNLRGFKFVTTLFLDLKKNRIMMKESVALFKLRY